MVSSEENVKYICKICELCKVVNNSIQTFHCVGEKGLFPFHFLLIPFVISC